jgi:hypothetical protein
MNASRNNHSEIESELGAFTSLDRQARMIILCVIAHDLTAGIRSALLDLSSPSAVEEARTLNEYLHQLTGRIYISGDQSGHGEAELLRDIADEADARGLKWPVMRRLRAALRHASAHAIAAEIA